MSIYNGLRTKEENWNPSDWNAAKFVKSYPMVEFRPKEAPDELWEAYFNLSEMIFREFNKRNRLPDRSAIRKRLIAPSPLYLTERWMVFDDWKRPVASASLSYDTEISPDYEGHQHICQIRISVAPDQRRKKIATHFLQRVIEAARYMGKDTIMAEVDNPLGLAFCRHFRGELLHEEVQYRLYLEDVDWQLVEKWSREGTAKSPRTRFEFFQECPESDIEEFCRIYTEVINQRPTGDMEQELITTPESRRIEERNLKNRGIQWYTMISREDDNRISGLTDIMYNPEEPYRMKQYLTGVLSRYRRRGLAKRLKAEMLAVINKRFSEVEYITTSMASTNRPMRAINKQLGFLPRKVYRIFQWELRELGERVDRMLADSSCS